MPRDCADRTAELLLPLGVSDLSAHRSLTSTWGGRLMGPRVPDFGAVVQIVMYQHFYGLRELPFELTPNPKYLYLPPGHREALSTLEYGLSSAKPVTALIGEAGTGKTTLLYAA